MTAIKAGSIAAFRLFRIFKNNYKDFCPFSQVIEPLAADFFASEGQKVADIVNKTPPPAYTETMEKLIISDKGANCRYLSYAAAALAKMGGVTLSIAFDSDRVSLCAAFEEPLAGRVCRAAEERVAEILCIGYKYTQLRAQVKTQGLSAEDLEMLLTAMIAADFRDDLAYVRSRLRGIEHHAIDGFYNFRLQALRGKWKGIAACVPPVFTREKLREFMSYLLGDGGEKVFLRGQEVYDSRCRRLSRSSLIESDVSEMSALREIVLSGAGEVECLGALSAKQELFLRRYYAGKVDFAK